jgi:hypothetical protein
MRRFLAALLGVPLGYLVFAFAGYWAIELFLTMLLTALSKPV